MAIMRRKISRRLSLSHRISCEMFGCSSAARDIGVPFGRTNIFAAM